MAFTQESSVPHDCTTVQSRSLQRWSDTCPTLSCRELEMSTWTQQARAWPLIEIVSGKVVKEVMLCSSRMLASTLKDNSVVKRRQ